MKKPDNKSLWIIAVVVFALVTYSNGSKCSFDSQCTSGVCHNTYCVPSSSYCGGVAPPYYFANGTTASNQWLTGICRSGTWKVVLNGIGCNSFACDQGTCVSNYCRPKANGQKCSTSLECSSGFCSNTVCCNTGQCGWPAEGSTPAQCFNEGGTRSNQWLSGICRSGQWKTVLNGGGCSNPSWPCDSGTCVNNACTRSGTQNFKINYTGPIEPLPLTLKWDKYAEIPPWVIKGGWYQYFITTDHTYHCISSSNILTSSVTFSSNDANCTKVLWGNTEGNPSPSSLTATSAWKRNYYGGYSNHVVNLGGTDYILSFNHGENKNELTNGLCYQNTINTGILCSSCASGDVNGNYVDCWEGYNAFVGMSSVPYTAATSWGRSSMNDLGPIVWPENGYLNSASEKMSQGVRHPSSIINNGYVYVYYLDMSNGGIKVARASLSSGNAGIMANNFYNYYGGGFSQKSLPDGFSKEKINNFLRTPGKPSTYLFGPSDYAIRFSVAKVKGTNYFIGVEEYFTSAANYDTIALRVSSDLVKWSEPYVIPVATGTWNTGRMHYPVLMNKEGTSNTLIDASEFYILGTDIKGRPNKIKVIVSV